MRRIELGDGAGMARVFRKVHSPRRLLLRPKKGGLQNPQSQSRNKRESGAIGRQRNSCDCSRDVPSLRPFGSSPAKRPRGIRGALPMGAAMSSRQRRGFGTERSGGLLALLGLQVVLEYGRAGATRPPVTAALLAANALVYLRPGALDDLLPLLSRASFNPYLIIKFGDWTRFFLSPFYHLSETHLFYNMTSLLWKGVQLETSMGSAEFASMVAALLGLSQGITLLLSKGLLLLGDDTSYYDQYAVGFSGVLFGMKVVLNAWSEDFVYLHGMVIPSKYAAWAELFLIQAFIPGTSFLGHLGGILAGLVYLQLKRLFDGPDLLTLLLSSVSKVVTWPVRFAQRLLMSGRQITGRGRVGRRASARETHPGIWRCSTCTYDNSFATDICEMCSTAREDRAFSRRQHHQAAGGRELSAEEVRRRRLCVLQSWQ